MKQRGINLSTKFKSIKANIKKTEDFISCSLRMTLAAIPLFEINKVVLLVDRDDKIRHLYIHCLNLVLT